MAKTIFQQTGFTRRAKRALCQDWDALERVTEFDYDLDFEGFKPYIMGRLGYLPDPKIYTPSRGQLQDLWELYMREKGIWPEEVQEVTRLTKLLTVYS